MNKKHERLELQKGKSSLKPEKWVELYADYLYSFAITRVSNVDIARDLVQDTFLSALEKRESFRNDSSEKTWLTSIIKYKIIDNYRKQSKGAALIKQDDGITKIDTEFFEEHSGHWIDKHAPKDFVNTHEDPLQNKEFMSTLQRCTNKLPPLWNTVFVMKHIDETETVEICKELCISINNFWVIIHRAKLNLRACLQKNWM